MFSLKGKKALITGASGGIGQAIARAFDRQGATLWLSGRKEKDLQKLAGAMQNPPSIILADLAQCTNRGANRGANQGGDANRGADKGRDANQGGDANKSGDVEKLCERIKKEGIDILINNAGITRDGLAVRLRDQDWQDVMDVNVTAAFQLCRAALTGMMRGRWGRIINISSIVASNGNAGQSAYGTAKAGLEGMTRCLAREVASRSITVNGIAPGYIETAMTASLADEQKARMLEAIPCGRAGQGDDVAAAAVFLASQEAAYVTGQIMHVNGGMRM